MKKINFCMFFLFVSFWASAQNWQWAKDGGGNDPLQDEDREEVTHIVTDSDGNVYIASRVSKTGLNIDGIPAIAYTNDQDLTNNIMLASFDCSGNYRWSKVIGRSSGSTPMGLAIDSQNNVYLTAEIRMGSYSDLHFDSDLIWGMISDNPPANFQTAFIVKYNQNGVFQWVRAPEPGTTLPGDYPSVAFFLSADIDNDGNLIVLTYMYNGVFCDGNYVNNAPEFSFHLLKYDGNGNFVSGKKLDIQTFAPDVYRIRSKYNPFNNTYVLTGVYFTISDPTVISLGGHNISKPIWMGCFDMEGQYLWHHQNTMVNSGKIPNLTVDPTDGSIYMITGLRTASGQNPDGEVDSFAGISFTDYLYFSFVQRGVIKLTADGVGVWGSNNVWIENGIFHNIAVNGNEVAVVYQNGGLKWGSFQGGSQNSTMGLAPALVRLDKATGVCVGLSRLDSPDNYANSASLTADHLGNYYIGGSYLYNLAVGNSLISNSSGNYNFYVAKYGTNNCNCQVPTCSFLPYNNTSQVDSVVFDYVGQNVYDSVLWDFGDGSASSSEVNPTHTYSSGGVYNVCVTATNSCDSYSFCGAVNTIALGSSSVDNNQIVTLKSYPNPVVDVLTITQLESLGLIDSKAVVMDLWGRVLFETPLGVVGNGDARLDMSSLSSGTYIVSVVPNNSLLIKPKAFKVIKS